MSLVVKDICKSFGEKQVLNKISFTCEPGKALGLLGRNGAGKTTTIRIILDIITSDEGEVLWKDTPIMQSGVNFGYLPEEKGLYPKIVIYDQLVYLAMLRGMTKPDANKAITYWFERLQMQEYLHKKVETLSKGNQQKIQLIVALINDPELVILDEPFSGLDPVNAEILKEVVVELLEKGKCVIFSSHQMQYVEEFCENIAIIHDGQIVLNGSLKEIRNSYEKTKILVKTDSDLANTLKMPEIADINTVKDGYIINLKEDGFSDKVLKEISENEIPVTKFEVLEPTLYDIFIEKVGAHQ